MKAEEFKNKVTEIVGSVKFEGHVEKVVNSLSVERQERLLEWVRGCANGTEIPEPCKNVNNVVCFIYKSGSNIRGLLSKEKNSYFIELFLDKHKYYDEKRKYLGI